MHRSIHALAVLFLAALAPPALAQSAKPQRFENVAAGISIVRPARWQTASLQTLQENRERIRLADPDLQATMQKAANAPLFTFMKYPEPIKEVNPSIQVQVRMIGPLAGSSAKVLMRVAVSSIRKALPDFVFVTDIAEAQVSGHAAAHMRANYTVQNNDGGELKVLSRMWLVPRGTFMFLISMSGPQEGKDVSEAEFEAALASITIQK